MSNDKVALLCHIGGDFVREEGKVFYNGGVVRLIYVDRMINHQELLKRLDGVCKLSMSTLLIKYKHPDIDFDSPFISPLITIEDENDLCNMMEVYSGPKPTVPFYISTGETNSHTSLITRCNSSHTTPWTVANAESLQAMPCRTELLRNTSVRENTNLDSPYPVEGSHDQYNALIPTGRAHARKKLFQTSETPSSEGRLDHDSDSSVATGNELGGEELNSSTSGSSREPNCNRGNSRRLTRSVSRYADAVPSAELVDTLNGSKELNFPQQESVLNTCKAVQLGNEGSLLKKGLEFENVDAFRKALTEASLLENFQYKPVKTTPRRIIVICVSKGCKWRLHASQLRGVAIFKIKRLNPIHTCGRHVVTLNHPNARVRWIANFIVDRLRENLDYKPKDIIADIHQQFGVKVSYHKAWRGRKRALGKIHGSFEESLKALPAYCREVERTNPKSILYLQCDLENSFQRLFIALYASIHGFLLGCRPLLVFKGTSIQGKYPSVLLFASAVDANGQGFPLAYAIAESENIDSWGWFLSWLRQALERELGNSLRSLPWLTVISEEQEGLVQGVKVSFPGAYHAFCVSHITQRIAKCYNDESIRDYIWAAASAYTKADYDHHVGELKKINIRAHEWIMANLKPKDWTTSHFEGQRYNVLTSDIGKNFTSWINDARDMPILSIVQELHSRSMTHFSYQRDLGMQMQSILVPTAEACLREKSKEALEFRVHHGSTTEREVFDTKGSKFLVNLSQQTCTCCEWQVEGLPCAHAVAVIQLDRLDLSQSCLPWFMTSRFQMAYSEEIHPIPDRSEWNYEDIITVKPPLMRNPRGRHKGCGIEKEVSDAYKQCSVCKKSGHNKRTCFKQQNVVSHPGDRQIVVGHPADS